MISTQRVSACQNVFFIAEVSFMNCMINRSIPTCDFRDTLMTHGDYMDNEDIEEMLQHADKNNEGKINYEGMSDFFIQLYICLKGIKSIK